MNGNKIERDFTNDDVASLWKDGLCRDMKEVESQDKVRFAKAGTVRVTYRLVEPVLLSDFTTCQTFEWEVENNKGIEVYSCKYLHLNTLVEAKVGDTVTITIKGLRAQVSLEEVDEWVLQYGVFVDDSR